MIKDFSTLGKKIKIIKAENITDNKPSIIIRNNILSKYKLLIKYPDKITKTVTNKIGIMTVIVYDLIDIDVCMLNI